MGRQLLFFVVVVVRPGVVVEVALDRLVGGGHPDRGRSGPSGQPRRPVLAEVLRTLLLLVQGVARTSPVRVPVAVRTNQAPEPVAGRIRHRQLVLVVGQTLRREKVRAVERILRRVQVEEQRLVRGEAEPFPVLEVAPFRVLEVAPFPAPVGVRPCPGQEVAAEAGRPCPVPEAERSPAQALAAEVRPAALAVVPCQLLAPVPVMRNQGRERQAAVRTHRLEAEEHRRPVQEAERRSRGREHRVVVRRHRLAVEASDLGPEAVVRRQAGSVRQDRRPMARVRRPRFRRAH